MRRFVEQVPVEAAVVVPLAPLADLAAHEEELLAGMPVHVGQQRPQRRVLLPGVARQLVEQRPLPVHDLVVGKRQDEVFAERVQHRERDVVVVPLPVDRVLVGVVQHVVHPAHVPLVGEAQTAQVHRPADPRKRRGLLRRRDRARMIAVRQRVQLLQEADGVEVFVAAELVGDPLALVARVVEVQHRGDGVHAQAVGVILLEPEQRARQQEIPHLVPAVVEDQRAPVLMLALPRVLVLEERRAVEAREPVFVLGKVARHPVENHAEAGLVAGVDELLELFRRAEAAGGREEPEHLVAPGSRERVLHDRQQLDVGEAHLLHVRHELVRQLGVREKPVAFLGDARPRPEVHFVDRHRPVEPASLLAALGHPRRVLPLVARDVSHDGRGLRRHLEGDAERVGLLEQDAGLRPDLELVPLAVRQVGHEDLPDPGGHEQPHRVDPAVPAVEVADDAHAIGGRRPHREVHARGRSDGDAVGAKLLERAMMSALAEQVQVVVGEHLAIAVGIVDLDAMVGVAVGAKGDPQAVVGRLVVRQARLEEPGRVAQGHRQERPGAGRANLDRPRRRLQRPHDPPGPGRLGVWPEDRERIPARAVDDSRQRRIERRLRSAVHFTPSRF